MGSKVFAFFSLLLIVFLLISLQVAEAREFKQISDAKVSVKQEQLPAYPTAPCSYGC